ncbi:MAG: nuclear transport factor 2 family protein [Methylibium sp.]|uniref:nuclear transport factor 2 family protein n=1 Tax=Methylibium sp. TaxID=2067992 RepID=UPI00179A3875|nr:nuclear transport factor 2 family protein [Methylibium sp.]MBA3597789.1 nuclear transport factor 2 family protein [Methylibium sp.]
MTQAPLATLETFYDAFRALDADRMQACYAPDARFDDPVFGLSGRDSIGGMWRMLCEGIRANGRADWRLEFRHIAVERGLGRAHWEARYRFSPTGARVHNVVDAEFSFDDIGLIRTHLDHFDLWRWSRQALGTKGLLLGWVPWFNAQLRIEAARRLDTWCSRAPQ